MKKKRGYIAVLGIAAMLIFAQSAMAFSDIKGDPAEASIQALQDEGLVNGVGGDRFAPQISVTYAEGVQLLVKGFHLNMDNIKFIKAPKASDFFTKVDDQAWYAAAFMIAEFNGLPLAKDTDPQQLMTREQFASLLYCALSKTGNYIYTDLFRLIADADQIQPDDMNSIQRLLNINVAALDENKKFRPKAEITRSEAADMLYRTLQFVKEQQNQAGTSDQKPNDDTNINKQVTLSTAKINDEAVKVTLTWGEMPNPGYQVKIDSIQFPDDGTAVINYRRLTPEPGKMYPQIVTLAKAETFIPANCTAVAKEIK